MKKNEFFNDLGKSVRKQKFDSKNSTKNKNINNSRKSLFKKNKEKSSSRGLKSSGQCTFSVLINKKVFLKNNCIFFNALISLMMKKMEALPGPENFAINIDHLNNTVFNEKNIS